MIPLEHYSVTLHIMFRITKDFFTVLYSSLTLFLTLAVKIFSTYSAATYQ